MTQRQCCICCYGLFDGAWRVADALQSNQLDIFGPALALNFGGAKLWWIWRTAFLSPNITLQNSPNYARWFVWCSFHQSLTLQNFYEDLFAKVWHHQSLALYGIWKLARLVRGSHWSESSLIHLYWRLLVSYNLSYIPYCLQVVCVRGLLAVHRRLSIIRKKSVSIFRPCIIILYIHSDGNKEIQYKQVRTLQIFIHKITWASK